MKTLPLILSLLLISISVHAETIYKDITEPLMVIEKNGIYPTIPGTTLRDYSEMPGFVIE